MSKAFTKENDNADDNADDDLGGASVPSGKNYITPAGFAKLKAEYDALLYVERPQVVETVSWAAGNGDRSENGDYLYGKKRMREIDRRMRFLSMRMKAAAIIDARDQPRKDQVFFGSTVTYADEDDKHRSITIVGQDELDANKGHISWISPVAKALMKARVGDVVTLVTPSGLQEIEIIKIFYPV